MPSNAERVMVADRAVNAMGEPWIDEDDPQANLIDLLVDLMHWADRRNVDFGDALCVAAAHYGSERSIRP